MKRSRDDVYMAYKKKGPVVSYRCQMFVFFFFFFFFFFLCLFFFFFFFEFCSIFVYVLFVSDY
jgi:hypothetical protein